MKASKGKGTKTKPEVTTASSSKPKKARTVWGVVGSIYERKSFKAYLEKITSAKAITQRGRAGIVWLKKQSLKKQAMIKKRIKEVDPEGYLELRQLILSVAQTKRRVKEQRRTDLMPADVTVDANLIGVEQEIVEVPYASTVRFVSQEGIKHVASIVLAAGYKREEAALLLGMDLGDLNSLVSNDDVKSAVKDVNAAVITAADQKVLRDLIAGHVSDETNRADLIATRRKKVALDASAEARNIVKDTEELQKKREDYLNKRFGVIQGECSEDNNG